LISPKSGYFKIPVEKIAKGRRTKKITRNFTDCTIDMDN
jgi:hypothetical protein